MGSTYRLQGSQPVVTSDLMLFGPLQSRAGVESIIWVDSLPVGQLNENSDIDFTISGNGALYTDLRRTRLCLQIEITDKNGDSIGADGSVVGPCNNLLSTVFSQVDVYFQQKLVSTVGTAYAYKAYLDNILNFGPGAKNSQLQTQLFYMDTPGALEQSDASGLSTPINEGLSSRAKFFLGKNVVDLEGPIFSSICQSDRFILNGVEIKLRLTQAKNKFRLMAKSDEDYRLRITQAILRVCKVKVTPSVIAAHDLALQTQNALYPFVKSEIKTYSIPSGSFNYFVDEIFSGNIPTKLVVAFVDSVAYNGSFTENPFNFKHYSLNFIGLSLDGQYIPSKPLKPKYIETSAPNKKLKVEGNYMSAYQTLFSGTGRLDEDNGLIISREDYPLGYAMYIFDLESKTGGVDAGNFPLIKKGNLKLEATFDVALPQTVNVILYANFGGIIELDRSRQVFL